MTTTKNGAVLNLNVINSLPELETMMNGGVSSAVAGRRRAALDAFDRMGFPTTRHEDWRYTDITPFINNNWHQPAHLNVPGYLPDDLQQQYVSEHMQRLVFVNGMLAPGLGTWQPRPGVAIEELQAALAGGNLVAEAHFAQYLDPNMNGMVALNTALATRGAFLGFGRGTVMEEPVYLVMAQDAEHGGDQLQVRNLIVADEGAQATVIIHQLSTQADQYLLNAATEIVVHKGANLKVYFVQTSGSNAAEVHTVQLYQEGGSNASVYTFSFGGQMLRNDLNVAFGGQHAEGHLYGLYVTRGSQHVDNHSFVDHAQPNCFSNEFFKGIMMDESSAVFNGKILVRPLAQKTNAYQSNKNILLSPKATINTKPQLEIFADDVKCSHGATTGQLDEDAIFYLRARGIPEAQARAMLTFAFAEDVISYVENETLRGYLDAVLEQRLSAQG